MIRRVLLDMMTGTAAGRRVGHLVYDLYGRRTSRATSLSTALFRNILQLQALEEPLADLPARGRLRVLNAASSTGCEAYTLAGYLAERFPALDWSIQAFDISPDAVAHAQAGVYASTDLPHAMSDTVRIIAERLFEGQGDTLTVRDDIRARVTFAPGDAVTDDLAAKGPYDLVLGQNFMIHMNEAMAAQAFANLASAMAPHGALFVHGIDLDLRERLAARHGLAPVAWRIAEIHDEDSVRRNAWPFYYWGLEPLEPDHPRFAMRYSSIYRKAAVTTR